MPYLKKLVSAKYLFTIDPLTISRSDWAILLVGAGALVLAIVLKIAALTAISPVDKKFRGKFYSLMLMLGVWELSWFGFRYQNIRFFGSHFVALLGLMAALIWGTYLIITLWRHYGQEKLEWEKEQIKLKYLPK